MSMLTKHVACRLAPASPRIPLVLICSRFAANSVIRLSADVQVHLAAFHRAAVLPAYLQATGSQVIFLMHLL